MLQPINKFDGGYRFLSNFYPCAIPYQGIVYPTVEAAFQAAKSMDLADKMRIAAMEPAKAKRQGKLVWLRSDWESVKLDVMRELLRIKFQNPELLGLLLRTGDAPLIEGNRWHDNYWGSCTCKKCSGIPGENQLGKLLMELRLDLRAELEKRKEGV